MPSRQPRPMQLSQQDMRTISQAISRDFTPRFFQQHADDRRQVQFSSQELREIAGQISRDYSHSIDNRSPRLTLLPVAPGHLHAYWQMGTPTPATVIQANVDADQQRAASLILRLYPDTATAKPTPAPEQPSQGSIDILLDSDHGHSDIRIEHTNGNNTPPSSYRAVLGWTDDAQHFQPLLYSNNAETASAHRPASQQVPSPAAQQSIMAINLSSSAAASTQSGQGKQSPE